MSDDDCSTFGVHLEHGFCGNLSAGVSRIKQSESCRGGNSILNSSLVRLSGSGRIRACLMNFVCSAFFYLWF